jgi:hypothetical protein
MSDAFEILEPIGCVLWFHDASYPGGEQTANCKNGSYYGQGKIQ